MDAKPEKKKRGRGRPVKYVIEPIPDTTENIAKAIFRDADKRIVKKGD